MIIHIILMGMDKSLCIRLPEVSTLHWKKKKFFCHFYKREKDLVTVATLDDEARQN